MKNRKNKNSIKLSVTLALIIFTTTTTIDLNNRLKAQAIKIRELPTNPTPSLLDYLIEDSVSINKTFKITPNALLALRTITCTSPLVCGGGSSHNLGSDFTLSLFGGGTGETNTASNVGATGVGVFDNKTGVDLRFRKIAAASSKITSTLNGQEIDLDVPDATTSSKGAVQLALTSSDVTAGHVIQASDARNSNSRTPTSHDGTLHTGNVFPSTPAPQTLGGTYIDLTPISSGSVPNPTATHQRIYLDSTTGVSVKLSDGTTHELDDVLNPPTVEVALTGGGVGTASRLSPGTGITTTDLGDGIIEIAESVVSISYKAQKTVAENRTSSPSLAMDNILLLTLPIGTYSLHLLVSVSSFDTAGFQCELRGTASFTTPSAYSSVTDGTAVVASPSPTLDFIGVLDGVSLPLNPISYSLMIDATIKVTIAGTVGLAWAQSTSDSTVTSVLPGSRIVAENAG